MAPLQPAQLRGQDTRVQVLERKRHTSNATLNGERRTVNAERYGHPPAASGTNKDLNT